MATSKKKKTPPPKKPAKTEKVEKTEAPDPGSEPESDPTSDAEPSQETKFLREQPKRSDEEIKAIRALVKKGRKAVEALVSVLDAFEPAPERAVKTAVKRLTDELDALEPPEPRKCKEYKRALTLARKGEMGIHPDDVMRYCRCEECHVLRDKAGLSHPPAPRAAS